METQQTLVNKLSQIFTGQKKTPKGPPIQEVLDATQHKFLDYLVFESPRLMKHYDGIIRLTSEQYMVVDPESFKHILKTKPHNYSKKNMTYERIKLLLGDGSITREGESWAHHRHLIAPFYERSKFPTYADIMVNITQDMLKNWESKKSINIVHELSFLTLRILLAVYCNHRATDRELQIMCDLLVKGGEHISYGVFPSPWIPTFGNFQFFSLIRKTNGILQNLIDKRRLQANEMSSEFEDIIDILLAAESTTGQGLSDHDMRDELRTLLFASHETTSCGLIWSFYLLAKHTEYWPLLQAELKSVLGDTPPSSDNWSQLPLTKAIFLESLRLFPSVWCLPRVNLEDDYIGETYIPRDTNLILNIFALHRNPRYWEDPHIFYPERFMSSATEEKRVPFSFLPFSLGPRTCIGSQFAMMEGVILLASIAQKYELTLRKSNKVYSPEPYLSLRPPHKIMLDLKISS